MFNPFVRFVPELIDAFRRHGERYLVSQTFKAGIDIFVEGRDVLMFSQYIDEGYARVHLQAVKADRFAAIIDLEKDKHRSRVMEMLEPDSRYVVFSNLIIDSSAVEKAATKIYAAKLRRYIEKNTTWRISVNSSLQPKLQLIFGELFIVIKFQSQQVRLKLDDIENF